MTTAQWQLPRESLEWIGPIVVTKTDAATGEPVTDPVEFAFLLAGERPVDSDYFSPYLDPDSTGALGILAQPVGSRSFWGIWARVQGNPEVPVLDPDTVGWVQRT